MRKVLRVLVPAFMRRRLRAERFASGERENVGKSAQEVFSKTYLHNSWGGAPGQIYSGDGSIGEPVAVYLKFVNEFIRQESIVSVVDLGCGDFAVGRGIECDRYTGVDVVHAVIYRNTKEFASPSISFVCRDLTGGAELPDGDLCLIRQVFQHLSNDQILSILAKLGKYKLVLVTEHLPADEDFLNYNIEKVHGQHTRLYKGSGVYLDRPPFNKRISLVCEYMGNPDGKDEHERGYIRTFLLDPSACDLR